jgi:hypothetical protein
MEKLSGILPASARTATAEVASAQPARPGALALGRPMGKNSLGDRVTISKQLEEMRRTGLGPEMSPPVTYRNSPEGQKLKVIDELNKKFFTDPKSLVRETDQTKSEEVLTKIDEASPSLFVVEDDLKPPKNPALKPPTSENNPAVTA